MKKLLFLVGVLLTCSSLYAGQDRFGNERLYVPRSSHTTTSEKNAFISSRAVVVYGVNIATGTANTWIVFFDTGTVVPQSSTITATNGDVAGYKPFGQNGTFGSNGLSYSKSGNTPMTIYWDYLVP